MLTTVTPRETSRSTWSIDPSHSTVEFGVKHLVFTTQKGRFAALKGDIVLDEADLSQSSVTAEIDAASVDTGNAERDAHLRSADFLDAETYPTLSFRSTSIQPTADGRSRIAGDLTIRGVMREVVLDAEYNGRVQDPWGGTRAGFSATAAIDRRDFGLSWNVPLEAGGLLVGDQVKVSLEIEAIKQ